MIDNFGWLRLSLDCTVGCARMVAFSQLALFVSLLRRLLPTERLNTASRPSSFSPTRMQSRSELLKCEANMTIDSVELMDFMPNTVDLFGRQIPSACCSCPCVHQLPSLAGAVL